jgi:hypothetical protein
LGVIRFSQNFPCNEKVKFNWENKLTLGCCQDHSTKASLLETHGVENNSQREEVKLKKIETSLEHYGVSNPSKVRNIRKKAENTMMEKYGYSNPSHSAEILKKKEKIYLERYGVTNPNKCSKIKEKTVNTKLEKYGVRHHFHNSTIFKKLMDSMYQQKEYKWETGEISILQGHEPIVLSELEENGYTFDIVKTDPKDMPEIFYEFEGKKKRYYPDFYIPSENLIIEVKSEYTLNKDFEMNQAKFKAVEDLGFNFKLEVR